ncbi:hypothetical protein OJ996_22705 [Luteolibacter sp. GHJ8]|uniref:Uncharacterized protein n=1 Tax=Luteolibacter rhizosphaerae TaxID=2989719 RepID=A0ABT3G995_9BACT|nr:hypothetical protein [Luteolibacter rhizosphaerae]MCW1916417.1 hypothetical protein [Luteolibacter rhizosphaerae]
MQDQSKRDIKRAPFAIRATVVFVELVAAGIGMLLSLAALGLVGVLFSVEFSGSEVLMTVAGPFVFLLVFLVLLAMCLAVFWFTRHLSISYRIGDSKRIPTWFADPGRYFADITLQVIVGYSVLALFVGGVATFRDGFGAISVSWSGLWTAMLLGALLVLRRFKNRSQASPRARQGEKDEAVSP